MAVSSNKNSARSISKLLTQLAVERDLNPALTLPEALGIDPRASYSEWKKALAQEARRAANQASAAGSDTFVKLSQRLKSAFRTKASWGQAVDGVVEIHLKRALSAAVRVHEKGKDATTQFVALRQRANEEGSSDPDSLVIGLLAGEGITIDASRLLAPGSTRAAAVVRKAIEEAKSARAAASAAEVRQRQSQQAAEWAEAERAKAEKAARNKARAAERRAARAEQEAAAAQARQNQLERAAAEAARREAAANLALTKARRWRRWAGGIALVAIVGIGGLVAMEAAQKDPYNPPPSPFPPPVRQPTRPAPQPVLTPPPRPSPPMVREVRVTSIAGTEVYRLGRDGRLASWEGLVLELAGYRCGTGVRPATGGYVWRVSLQCNGTFLDPIEVDFWVARDGTVYQDLPNLFTGSVERMSVGRASFW